MINITQFKEWLEQNTELGERSIKDVLSRLRRANRILPLSDDPAYFFHLCNTEDFKALTMSVRSQLKKAVHLYTQSKNQS